MAQNFLKFSVQMHFYAVNSLPVSTYEFIISPEIIGRSPKIIGRLFKKYQETLECSEVAKIGCTNVFVCCKFIASVYL